MLSKVNRLFNRYCDHHFAVYAPGFPIYDATGRKLGQVERVCFGRNSLRVEGWSVADGVTLGRVGRQTWQKPDIMRTDVNAAMGLPQSKRAGFNLPWFGETHGMFLSLKTGGTMVQILCPNPGRFQRFKAQIHIRLSFSKAMFRAMPALARAVLFPTAGNRIRAKRALGLEDGQSSHILDSRVFDKARPIQSNQKITLIMPVFNAFDVLQEALERIAANTDMRWRLILVEDCSTDTRVRPMLNRWCADKSDIGLDIELIENQENVGFIGSVNKAFKRALEYNDHVVLINSDALLPKDWAHRLLTPILKNPRVASVTPFSNDAEIFTVPIMSRPSVLAQGEADKIDTALGANVSSHIYQTAPTGVGFCMAINASFLKKIPKLDAVFGKGYGEEVDWCQKASARGGLHVCQPNLFVEHRGGASFGTTAKRAAITKNNLVISTRYPLYDRSVQRFMADDPLRTPRMLAAMARLAASQREVKIYIAHSLGGGAELYLQEKLAELTEANEGVIVLRVGGALRWRIEVHTAQGVLHGDSDDSEMVHKLLSPVHTRALVYSCAVGEPDPLDLTHEIEKLMEVEEARLSFLVHDYYAISPSYCLLSSRNTYDGVPKLKTTDRRHSFRMKNGTYIANEQWRDSWRRLLDLSSRIICFSDSSARIMRAAFPDTTTEIVVNPHKVPDIRTVRTRESLTKPCVGILGDIGAQKGAKVLSGLSQNLPTRGVGKMVIVGRVDPQFPLGPQVTETGSYKRNEIATLAERHAIQCWFIPSIWPETFSYTTHEALATGLPVFAFDIGAQGDAVAEANNGHAVPFHLRDDPEKLLIYIEEVLAHGTTRRRRYPRAKGGRNRGFAA